MQIDLVANPKGEVGLISNQPFESDISGIIFDIDERALTLEYGQSMDSLRLNIPIGDDFVDALKKAPHIHVCAIDKGRMVSADRVKLTKVSSNEDDLY